MKEDYKNAHTQINMLITTAADNILTFFKSIFQRK